MNRRAGFPFSFSWKGNSVRKLSVLAFAAAVVGTVALAVPAQATSYNGKCESSGGGEICLYKDANFTGGLYDTLYSKPSYTGTYYGTNTSINNSVTSVINKDPSHTAFLFDGANYTGESTTIGNGGSYADLGYGGIMNNRASSHCFINNVNCP